MTATFQPLPDCGSTPDTLSALVLMNDNSLYLYQDGMTSGELIDTNVMAFQGLAVDQCFTLHADGTLYYLPYQLRISNVQAFYALSSAEYLAIHTNGELYLYQIPTTIQMAPPPTTLAVDVQAVQASSDLANIYFLQPDGVLYYKPGTSADAIAAFGPVQGLAPGQVPVQPPVQDFQLWAADALIVAGGNLYYATPPFNSNSLKTPPSPIVVKGAQNDLIACYTYESSLTLLVLTNEGALYYHDSATQSPSTVYPPIFTDVVAMSGYLTGMGNQTPAALAVTRDGRLWVLAAPSWTPVAVPLPSNLSVALAPPPLTAPIVPPYWPPRPVFL
jgi:hypothetical protein